MKLIGYIKKFSKMHSPEQGWILSHIFQASKALKATQRALEVTKLVSFDPDLDGEESGGQVDAFRHAFWMASLSRVMSPQKAYKLGIAHEKGNEIDYKKKRLEEGATPDKVSSEMDLRNNEAGIKIGRNNPNCSEEELIQLIKNAILNGELWILKRNIKGEFLDWDGNVLKKSDYHGKWVNKKCLVPSDYKPSSM